MKDKKQILVVIEQLMAIAVAKDREAVLVPSGQVAFSIAQALMWACGEENVFDSLVEMFRRVDAHNRN